MFGRFIAFLFCIKICFAANVLVVDSMPSPSHQIWNYGIVEGLLERGHNVTVMGPKSVRPAQHKNYHHLDLTGLYNAFYDDFDSEEASAMGVFSMLNNFYEYTLVSCNHSLHTPGFRKLMTYPKDKFDVILIDLTVGECFLPLIQHFNYPPTVALTAMIFPTFLSFEFGNDLQLAINPSMYTTFSDDMTFVQRLKNYFATYIDIYNRETYVRRELKKLLVKEFGAEMETFPNLLKHVSLLLANWNAALNYPQALPPNIIPVGGQHIRPKKLPKDLLEIMDSNPNGVILFSLGTNVRADRLSADKIQMFVRTLNKLKHTVLWKYESNITGLASHVIVRKWLPQTDLLAHPNMKLFISHCGGLSTSEATHLGVPVLGIPFFFDQLPNINNLVIKGAALAIDHFTLTEDVFLENINELLYNEKYSKNMKELANRLRDQPETALERALFWIEYVIRHNGAEFLSTKARTLPLFISSSADIHLFILCVISISIYILFRLFKFVKLLFLNDIKTENKPKKD